jgi:hypothetical protein
MAEEGTRLETVLRIAGSIVAPATALSALLFYFGYVSSRAQYNYFGVDVDTIGLSTQDYVMRSPQPLLGPLLVLTLLGAGGMALHTVVRRRATADAGFRRVVRRGVAVGIGLIGVGVVLLFVYPLLIDWTFYPLVTPLVLATGGTLTAYGLTTLRLIDARSGSASASTAGRRGVIVLIWVTVGSCVFWSTATIAQWSGLGLGQQQARRLDTLPSVILDTKERLFLPQSAGVEERRLGTAADGGGFRFRYWRLRLLIEGHDRMFLVPERWNPGDTTLVVPLNDQVRVQFQFRNLAP